MVDRYNNHATVVIGDTSLEIVASKLAEKFYGERFRQDVEALGESNSVRAFKVPTYDDEGKPVVDEEGKAVCKVEHLPLTYTGRLKMDIAVSANSRIGSTAEIPDQVVAATWAMARAAGSTDKSYDDFYTWWLTQPSSAKQDLALWEAVCVDLAERAFFRDYGRPDDAHESDEVEEPEQTRSDG